jgi:bifunctional non-homologous end joining protein LigD
VPAGSDPFELPLLARKERRAPLLPRRSNGIFTGSFEQGAIGPDLFRKACELGLEGLASKRRDWPYRAGRSKDWVKIKNRSHPALDRVQKSFG